jgi:phenylacetate-CoA ligase
VVLGKVLSKMPLPLLLGADFRRWYKFALEADRWSAERIREYQLVQLRRIVTLAYERTAFYRESFENVGFQPGDLKRPEDLRALPTIDKTIVRENWERMLTLPIDDRTVDLVTTGGTSGEPMRFYMSSARHGPEFAHLTACWSRVGYRPGDEVAVLRGKLITRPVGGMYYQRDPLLRHHYYSTFHMSPDDLRAYVTHIQNVQPRFLHAYPSSLYALAKFMVAENISFPESIDAVLLESEPIMTHQRELVEKRMGLRMFASYGHSEKLIMAAECERSSAYHVLPSYGYCEVIDPGGGPAAEGVLGEVTGTGFINDVMPFIRYRTGDAATVGAGTCTSCGREHQLLESIQGRWGKEFLICRDGQTLISMTSLNLHDDTFDGIARFQFVQDEPGKATLNLVRVKETGDPDPARFQRHFEPKLAHGVDLKIAFVAEIPLTRMGKQPMILQRCPDPPELLQESRREDSRSSPAVH